MIVIDASAVLQLLLRRPGEDLIVNKIVGLQLIAPHVIDNEIVHTLRRYSLRGELTDAEGRAELKAYLAMPIRRYPQDVLLERMWELRHNLTAYDASYVALAETLNVPLLTLDRKILDAPHRAKIDLVESAA